MLTGRRCGGMAQDHIVERMWPELGFSNPAMSRNSVKVLAATEGPSKRSGRLERHQAELSTGGELAEALADGLMRNGGCKLLRPKARSPVSRSPFANPNSPP